MIDDPHETLTRRQWDRNQAKPFIRSTAFFALQLCLPSWPPELASLKLLDFDGATF